MGGACGMQGWGEKKHVQSFAEETLTKEPPGRSKHRRESNMKIELKQIEWEAVRLDSSGEGYGQVADCCERSNEPSGSTKNSGNFLKS